MRCENYKRWSGADGKTSFLIVLLIACSALGPESLAVVKLGQGDSQVPTAKWGEVGKAGC